MEGLRRKTTREASQQLTKVEKRTAYEGGFVGFCMQSSYYFKNVDYEHQTLNSSGIIIMIIAPRLLPFGGHPAVGFGPKLEEMNPRTFPDLPICPRTLDFDQKTSKIATNKSKKKIEKS